MNIARTIRPFARQTLNRNIYRKFNITSSRFESTQATQPKVQEEKYDFEDLKVLERTDRRKPPIEPFMKNVFLSKFNRDLLAYPEILSKDEREDLDRRVDRLDSVFSDSNKSPEDRVNCLKQNRMYAAPAKLTDNGLAMNVTERLRYLETISTDVYLAKQLSDHWVGLEALQKGLKENDFQKLLPNLVTGEKTINIAVKERLSVRIAQPDFSTVAELDSQGIWRIDGEKECYKADSYLIVIAQIEASRFRAFLVLPQASGMSYQEPIVSFKNVAAIPLDQVPDESLASTLALCRLDTAVLCHSQLRNLIMACIKYVRGKYVSGEPLANLPTIRTKIAEALFTLYAAESATYFTAGLLDGYHSPDAELEMAMCRNYITHHGLKAMLKLLSIPGLNLDKDFESRLHEFRGLAFREETEDNINNFIALTGLSYVGKSMSEEIKQIRNPLNFPKIYFKKLFENRKQEKDEPKLDLYLKEHLHPSLTPASELLEYCVVRMRYACELLMARHGVEAIKDFPDLERIAKAATEILMMTAVQARASRAYCIGLRNSENEMKLAAAITEKTRPRVKQLILDLENGEYVNLDHIKIHMGQKVLDNSEPLVEKPIERVFW